VRYVADRVAVMQAGRIVETGTADEIFEGAAHPMTRALLAASAATLRGRRRERTA
jgi:ABC-type oligopeptide transport system ATPase subunit